MTVNPITSLSDSQWLRLRRALWPGTSEHEHLAEMQSMLAEPDRFAQFCTLSAAGVAVGLAEASIRQDHVNGADTSPVGYLEGLYVEPAARQGGIARALVLAVAHWARNKGCAELVSDTQVENLVSQATHIALGFKETERSVFYKMAIATPSVDFPPAGHRHESSDAQLSSRHFAYDGPPYPAAVRRPSPAPTVPKPMLNRISAGVIIEHEDRLLLVRHVRPGRYDFWVAPGGGVKGAETLEQAAAREALEEAGVDVEIGRLLYIEEFFNPECRHVKFWFAARVVGGQLDWRHPEAVAEYITQAAWHEIGTLSGLTVFPTALTSRYAADRKDGFPIPIRLPIREMAIW